MSLVQLDLKSANEVELQKSYGLSKVVFDSLCSYNVIVLGLV